MDSFFKTATKVEILKMLYFPDSTEYVYIFNAIKENKLIKNKSVCKNI